MRLHTMALYSVKTKTKPKRHKESMKCKQYSKKEKCLDRLLPSTQCEHTHTQKNTPKQKKKRKMNHSNESFGVSVCGYRVHLTFSIHTYAVA